MKKIFCHEKTCNSNKIVIVSGKLLKIVAWDSLEKCIAEIAGLKLDKKWNYFVGVV